MIRRLRFVVLPLFLAMAGTANAGVLPDDRGDALYHMYVGGVVEIVALPCDVTDLHVSNAEVALPGGVGGVGHLVVLVKSGDVPVDAR